MANEAIFQKLLKNFGFKRRVQKKNFKKGYEKYGNEKKSQSLPYVIDKLMDKREKQIKNDQHTDHPAGPDEALLISRPQVEKKENAAQYFLYRMGFMKVQIIAEETDQYPGIKERRNAEESSQIEIKRCFFLVVFPGKIKRKRTYEKEEGYSHPPKFYKIGPTGDYHVGLGHLDHVVEENVNGRDAPQTIKKIKAWGGGFFFGFFLFSGHFPNFNPLFQVTT